VFADGKIPTPLINFVTAPGYAFRDVGLCRENGRSQLIYGNVV